MASPKGTLSEQANYIRDLLDQYGIDYDRTEETPPSIVQVIKLPVKGVRWYVYPRYSKVVISGTYAEIFTGSKFDILRTYMDELNVIADDANAALRRNIPQVNQKSIIDVNFQSTMMGDSRCPSVGFELTCELNIKYVDQIPGIITSFTNLFNVVLQFFGPEIDRLHYKYDSLVLETVDV